MLIRIGFDIQFELPAATPMHVLLSVHPSHLAKIRQPESLRVLPEVPVEYFIDLFGNTCGRLVAPPGLVTFRNEATVEDSGEPDAADPTAAQHPVEELPADALQFLLASRYCEVDLMRDIAWQLFADTPPTYERATAICEWVHHHLTFSYPQARPTRTAMDAYQERIAVCRDFTHLAITLSRAMNIPARYATGYLGDIGVPIDPNPMDFSAWYEVYLGGRWWTLDARHNQRRIGRVLMARGRDAVDCALTTVYGATTLKKFTVVTEEWKT
jgi:transglutaminase-like putative cysteine protease